MAGKNFIKFVHKGNFNRMEGFLVKAIRIKPIILAILNKYGKRGVEALKEATPKDTGLTADSWEYKIVEEANGNMKIEWHNTNIQNGCLIAVLLQYGHTTRNGGYVQGQDYVNPAIARIFGQLADDAWKEVSYERSR